jgi:DNA-binding transcriptional MerR regulator
VSNVALPGGQPYFSIGEVLNVLKDSFPDVTVSKIRFLESEGLIEPERTASGYRKFTEGDIERLRFILQLQREHFLPLKVIRERLEELDEQGDGQPRLELAEAEEEASTEDQVPLTGTSMSTNEIARASGLTVELVEELVSYRMLQPTEVREAREGEEGPPMKRFNEKDLEAAKLCRALLELGLEPRHLKVFRNAAERWADLAEQMIRPLTRQRHPEARREAHEKEREVIRVGMKLVRVWLRDVSGPLA